MTVWYAGAYAPAIFCTRKETQRTNNPLCFTADKLCVHDCVTMYISISTVDCCVSNQFYLLTNLKMNEARKIRRKEGRKEGRKAGKKERKKERKR